MRGGGAVNHRQITHPLPSAQPAARRGKTSSLAASGGRTREGKGERSRSPRPPRRSSLPFAEVGGGATGAPLAHFTPRVFVGVLMTPAKLVPLSALSAPPELLSALLFPFAFPPSSPFFFSFFLSLPPESLEPRRSGEHFWKTNGTKSGRLTRVPWEKGDVKKGKKEEKSRGISCSPSPTYKKKESDKFSKKRDGRKKKGL